MLGGLDTPTKGSVTLAGKDLYRMKEDALAVFRRRKIGFVFQAFNLFSSVNVWEKMCIRDRCPGLQAHAGQNRHNGAGLFPASNPAIFADKQPTQAPCRRALDRQMCIRDRYMDCTLAPVDVTPF